jgi:voltage-gated potassium channel Kch
VAVTKKPLTVHASRAFWADAGERKKRIRAWQDRIRDPSLSVLLVLQICTIFFAAPLAARGLPIARAIGDTLLLAGVAVVVLLSQRRGAIVVILFGLAAMLASFLPEPGWPASMASALRHGGSIVTFSALTWVVLHAVYAPGRITFHRLQGAVVVYLNLATIFAAIFSLIWESSPGAFVILATQQGGLAEVATMIYFSLTTLTTTGYGDIVPVDPFARSLANLESVAGQFYLAITVARLVTLEMADRRR